MPNPSLEEANRAASTVRLLIASFSYMLCKWTFIVPSARFSRSPTTILPIPSTQSDARASSASQTNIRNYPPVNASYVPPTWNFASPGALNYRLGA